MTTASSSSDLDRNLEMIRSALETSGGVVTIKDIYSVEGYVAIIVERDGVCSSLVESSAVLCHLIPAVMALRRLLSQLFVADDVMDSVYRSWELGFSDARVERSDIYNRDAAAAYDEAISDEDLFEQFQEDHDKLSAR